MRLKPFIEDQVGVQFELIRWVGGGSIDLCREWNLTRIVWGLWRQNWNGHLYESTWISEKYDRPQILLGFCCFRGFGCVLLDARQGMDDKFIEPKYIHSEYCWCLKVLTSWEAAFFNFCFTGFIHHRWFRSSAINSEVLEKLAIGYLSFSTVSPISWSQMVSRSVVFHLDQVEMLFPKDRYLRLFCHPGEKVKPTEIWTLPIWRQDRKIHFYIHDR